jgi:predicted nucleic acid-binding protein
VALVILDSDVAIDHARGVPGVTEILLSLIREDRLVTTVTTIFELERGRVPGRSWDRLMDLVNGMPVLNLTVPVARLAGELAFDLDRKGAKIAMGDLLIAALTLHHDGELLTRNIRHFSRIPSLKLFGES